MADNEQQQTVDILAGDANLVHTENVVSIPVDNVHNGEGAIQDILQQAFQEASGPYVQEPASFAHGQVTLADGTSAIALSDDVKVEGQVIYQLAGADVAVSDLHSEAQEIQCLSSDQLNGNTGETTLLQQVVGEGLGDHIIHGDQIVVQLDDDGTISKPFQAQVHEAVGNGTTQQVTLPQNVIDSNGLNVTQDTTVQNTEPKAQVPVAVVTKTDAGLVLRAPEPLGSSQNPIRIVQQGSQYTSLQQLSGEQLSQIMQVVQQQQLLKKTQAAADDSAILYNPQTKTRIVYKVIYPSELHKNSSTAETVPNKNLSLTSSNSGTRRTICVPTDSIFVGLPKRTYRKRAKNEDDEKVEAPELSKEEKDEKKKHRPRTRSGRVSRPPKHMVKDYKHIHPVDWDEDYDDSDGGYSDFQPSSGEGGEGDEDASGAVRKKRDGSYMPYSLMGHGKSKPWKCKVCDKAYIGKAGLARHYRLVPEHGKDDENFKDAGFHLAADSGNSLDSMPGTIRENENTATDITATGTSDNRSAPESTAIIDTTSTDSKSDTLPTATTAAATAKSTTSKPMTVATSLGLKQTNGHPENTTPKGNLQTKQESNTQEPVPNKRKARLKEFVREFSDEDLMEIVLPRLSRAVSTWEFMLMKAERGRLARPQLVDLLQEYAQLYRSLHKMTEQQLKPVTPGQKVLPGTTQIQISDSIVATSLGLSTGMYTVQPPPRKEDSFRYKLLTTDADNVHNPSSKRTLETVNSQDMFQPTSKRPRTTADQASTETVAPKVESPEGVKPGQTLLKSDLTTPLPIQANKSQTVVARSDHQSSSDNPQGKVLTSTASLVTSQYGTKPEAMQVQENCNGELMQPSLKESPPRSKGSSVYKNTVLESVDFADYKDIESGAQVGQNINLVLHPQEKHENASHVAFVTDTQHLLMESSSLTQPQSLQDVLNSDSKPVLPVEEDSVAALDPSLPSVGEADVETTTLKVEEQGQEDGQWQQFDCSGPSTQDSLEQGHVKQEAGASLEGTTGSIDPEQGSVPLSMEYDETITGSHITQQYITENGLILDDGSNAQVLVQEEPFLVQNGFQETGHADINAQGEVQDASSEDNRLILIKNPDGTIQIHRQGNQPISLETLQTLLGMELNVPVTGSETSEAI